MRTEQIHYLEAIHRLNSINKAADSLHLSPQALSLSMNALEEELNVQVVIRNRSGTFLTPKGLDILTAGKAFLDQLDNILSAREQKYPELTNAKMDILLTNGVAETLFPAAISQLYLDCPHLQLHMQRRQFDDILSQLAHSPAEIAFIYSLSIDGLSLTDLTGTPYRFDPLCTGAYYCVAHQKFALAQYSRLSLKTLLKYPIILYAPTKDVILRLLAHAGGTANLITIDDFALYRQMLKDGAGAALYFVMDQPILPDMTSNHLHLIPFKEDITSSLGCLRQNDAPLSPQAHALIRYLQDFYALRLDKAFTFI